MVHRIISVDRNTLENKYIAPYNLERELICKNPVVHDHCRSSSSVMSTGWCELSPWCCWSLNDPLKLGKVLYIKGPVFWYPVNWSAFIPCWISYHRWRWIYHDMIHSKLEPAYWDLNNVSCKWRLTTINETPRIHYINRAKRNRKLHAPHDPQISTFVFVTSTLEIVVIARSLISCCLFTFWKVKRITGN